MRKPTGSEVSSCLAGATSVDDSDAARTKASISSAVRVRFGSLVATGAAVGVVVGGVGVLLPLEVRTTTSTTTSASTPPPTRAGMSQGLRPLDRPDPAGGADAGPKPPGP